MDAKRCDRCGLFYVDDRQTGKPKLTLNVKELVDISTFRYADLCSKCVEALLRWWRDGDEE